MAKILAFVGSPRKDGYTAKLVQAAGKGAFSRGSRVKYYDLNDPDFRGCQGCFRCRVKEGCAVLDYLQPAYEEIPDAPALIIGTPIYFYDITGQMKMWLDRMFPMIDAEFAPRYPGKKVATVFTQGDTNPTAHQPAIDRFHQFLEHFGWQVTGSLVCTGTTDDDYELPETLLNEAHNLGEKLLT